MARTILKIHSYCQSTQRFDRIITKTQKSLPFQYNAFRILHHRCSQVQQGQRNGETWNWSILLNSLWRNKQKKSRKFKKVSPSLPALGAPVLMILPVTPFTYSCQCALLWLQQLVSVGWPVKHDLMQLKWACVFALPLHFDSCRLLTCSMEHNVLQCTSLQTEMLEETAE